MLVNSGFSGSIIESTPLQREYWEQQYEELHQKIIGNSTLKKSTVKESDAFDTSALILPDDRTPFDILLRRTRLLLQDLKRQGNSPRIGIYERLLEEFQPQVTKTLAKTSAENPSGDKEPYIELAALNRAIAMDNPLMDFDTILFVGYYLPNNEKHMCCQYNPWNINVGVVSTC
jgi:hypothetical protein